MLIFILWEDADGHNCLAGSNVEYDTPAMSLQREPGDRMTTLIHNTLTTVPEQNHNSTRITEIS